jgi:hypothetical protein
MKKPVSDLFWDQGRHFRFLMNDPKALSLANAGPFLSPGRFSARLWGTSRGAQWGQQFAHSPTYLLRGRLAILVLPRAKRWRGPVTREDQQIVGNGYQMTPALKLCWGSQLGFVPQQTLFVKTVAMFLAEAVDVRESDCWQILTPVYT